MNKVVVVGGGASGMMAAIAALESGSDVVIYDGNEKLGKKLYITGKGRCNLTNDCDISDYFDNIISNKKFLYSALYSYTNRDLIDFMEENGCPIKIERGLRAFPTSDKSSDVIRTLERHIKSQGGRIVLNTKASRILISNRSVRGVKLSDGRTIEADRVIIATGGLSYPTTGSTGDGLRLARECGHNIKLTHPALVPLVTKESYISRMQGLSLRNVNLRVYDDNKKVYDNFGEMLFTHFGISGPLVLSASSIIYDRLSTSGTLRGVIDMKPALRHEQLEQRILREIDANKNKELRYLVTNLVPAKMVDVIIDLLHADSHLKLNALPKVLRRELVNLLKEFTYTITGTRGFNEAIITGGGVDVRDINSSTMESLKISGLYFAGEVIDVDALTGGFNLQIAFSTGHLAGVSASI